MGILSWIILGLLAGALAKFLMPGSDSTGLVATMLLGIVGALVGGFIGGIIGFGSVHGLNIGSIITATLGAFVVLYLFKKFR
ncbi:GlsB/YeaQ/YmgE family stress response membrane protein [uncultured Cetobacterium sp.]|uniref:GlsB/YeaQ/YmgE family stress response membrane protein n=1 Tax=uncultured Cetobacterium sp. TaxID=527638 RepID=UPI002624066C|nr:GlsB/YeaQ/YmgE family stress response membrane protein [uncultured Cetobacterium sp.]